jgi:hypothetical protein
LFAADQHNRRSHNVQNPWSMIRQQAVSRRMNMLAKTKN